MDKIKAEVLRYLGHRRQEVPAELSCLIDECITLMRNAATPRHTSLSLDISDSGDGLSLSGTGLLLEGKDIARHLSGCGKAVLMAATLGVGADRLILQWERRDLTRSLILDACATQYIEECCDESEAKIRADAADSGLTATGRYSPGYGDLPLDIQLQILALLNADRRIGLTCTENYILLPRKSVTAIIGLGENPAESRSGCESCAMRDTCEFREDGSINGCSRPFKK